MAINKYKPATVSVEPESIPVKTTNTTAIRGVVHEIEDGLESFDAFPAHVLAWLRIKLGEIKSHL